MNIHEYQAKAVLKSFGAPVAEGVPVLSLDDVQKAVDTLPGPLWVVKSQIHAGGRGKGKFINTEYVATDERTGPRFPLLLTTGRILSQYNVGAQTRRTNNVVWHDQDLLEIHPHDAETRGIKDGDFVRLASRSGETTLRATLTDRVNPGVVYTTFHHPDTQANVITTDYSDWATNCPEYKVTAVQVAPSNGPTEWQEDYNAQAAQSRRIAAAE